MSDLIGSTLVVLSATIALTFMVVYHLKAHWWRTNDGRHVFTFMGVITTVLLLTTAQILVGDAAWFEWLRVAAFAGVPVVLTWRLGILIQAQSRRTIRTGRQRDRT